MRRAVRRRRLSSVRGLPRGFLASVVPLALMTTAAFGQGGAPGRHSIRSSPPNAAQLGQAVALSVQPATAGASYRFVATMLTTGAGTPPPTRLCARGQTIGTGPTVTWIPASGTYRLTAYGPSPKLERDTLVSQYEVSAPNAMVTAEYIPPQPPPGGTALATLIVGAKDLGPGHRYRFSVHFGTAPASPNQAPQAPPPPWTFESERASLRYPVSVPSTIPAFVTATVHHGDPCQIVAVGASPSAHATR
jgi:hypothetical protein